jgi:hypothetical protein
MKQLEKKMQADFDHKMKSYSEDMAKKLRKIEDERDAIINRLKEDVSKRHSVRCTK